MINTDISVDGLFCGKDCQYLHLRSKNGKSGCGKYIEILPTSHKGSRRTLDCINAERNALLDSVSGLRRAAELASQARELQQAIEWVKTGHVELVDCVLSGDTVLLNVYDADSDQLVESIEKPTLLEAIKAARTAVEDYRASKTVEHLQDGNVQEQKPAVVSVDPAHGADSTWVSMRLPATLVSIATRVAETGEQQTILTWKDAHGQ